MVFVVIRDSNYNDDSAISGVVRNAFVSNVGSTWITMVFNEITFELITFVSAIMFIFMGISFYYCILSIPIVLLSMYILIYGSTLIKSAESMHKRPLKCLVAEAYEPLFHTGSPRRNDVQIVPEEKLGHMQMEIQNCRKRIIGTVSVTKHTLKNDWAFLYRLAVDKHYRRNGIGLNLTQIAKNWCKENDFNNIELAFSCSQDGCRELFHKAGFEVAQLYNKKLFTSAFSLQMFQLRCEVRRTF